MYIRNILSILFILFSLSTFANVDSTGVQNNKGKKLIIHKVEPKETYYSLGRKYAVSPKEIMEFNNNISLQIGTVLNIPTDRPFDQEGVPAQAVATAKKIEKAPPRAVVNTRPTFIRHKVKPKETLSEIAEEYDTSVKTIQRLNNMKGTNLQIGQTLKVRQKDPVLLKPEVRNDPPVTASIEPEKEEPKKIDLNHYGLREQSERGAATWIDDENVDGSKLLVLHSTAPVGTVMKITSPMTGKTTFAKVVGRFTENENTKDVIIVVTKAVADLLGTLDKRFQVNIDYGISE